MGNPFVKVNSPGLRPSSLNEGGIVVQQSEPFLVKGGRGELTPNDTGYETRRAELYPEVRDRADKYYAAIHGVYAKYRVADFREFHDKAKAKLIRPKKADVVKLDKLLVGLEKVLDKNQCEDMERVLTLGPDFYVGQMQASNGHLYVTTIHATPDYIRGKENADQSIIMDGEKVVYRGKFHDFIVDDGVVYINREMPNSKRLSISRVSAKNPSGFKLTSMYSGLGTDWSVTDGKLFVEDYAQRPARVFLVKKHNFLTGDDVELAFTTEGSVLGPRYEKGHVYVAVYDNFLGKGLVYEDGKPWKQMVALENWFVRDGKLVETEAKFDGGYDRYEDGVKVEYEGQKYGEHYYSIKMGSSKGNDKVVKDGLETILKKVKNWRFDKDCLFVEVEDPEGVHKFFKITGQD